MYISRGTKPSSASYPKQPRPASQVDRYTYHTPNVHHDHPSTRLLGPRPRPRLHLRLTASAARDLALDGGPDKLQDELAAEVDLCWRGAGRHVQEEHASASLLPPQVRQAREVDEVAQVPPRVRRYPQRRPLYLLSSPRVAVEVREFLVVCVLSFEYFLLEMVSFWGRGLGQGGDRHVRQETLASSSYVVGRRSWAMQGN